ncbi:MAG: hypothetical protein K2N23_06990 [Clostridia bacterium]|nr:hypothetical protein [Clostridia bacterium]
MADFEVKSLLPQFRQTVGDFTPSSDLDDYYLNFLSMAAASLRGDDISDEVLQTELGKSAVILFAKALMDGKDVAADPTLKLLRNTLSVQTKGDRYADGS